MSTKRVVAITGASAGIGRATAVRLARDGASVAICARRRDRLEDAAADIERAGGVALPIVGDVTREEDMRALVARTVERFGALDVMVCSAGFGLAGAIDDVTPEQMRKLVDVNYMGTYYAAREALAVFRRQAHGHVIVVSSIVGKRGVPFVGAYSATKFAQVGLAECIRAEVAGSNIHVSIVFPVSTPTEFHEVMARESGAVSQARGPKQPVDRVADAIARAVARPVAEVYPDWRSRGLVWLNTIAPAFCDRFVQKFGRQPIT